MNPIQQNMPGQKVDVTKLNLQELNALKNKLGLQKSVVDTQRQLQLIAFEEGTDVFALRSQTFQNQIDECEAQIQKINAPVEPNN